MLTYTYSLRLFVVGGERISITTVTMATKLDQEDHSQLVCLSGIAHTVIIHLHLMTVVEEIHKVSAFLSCRFPVHNIVVPGHQ